MSDISKIKLPSGDIYNIKDIEARTTVDNLSEVAYSGSYTDLADKPTIPTVPTNVSAFTNDSGYITNSALSGYATETYVDNAVGDLVGVQFGGPYNSVEDLPATGSGDTIYLVSNSSSEQNVYDEYLWITNKYEKIGTTEVDLTNYALKSELPTKVSDLTNDSGFITSADLPTNHMVKGVDYVTAGKRSDTTLGSNATAEGFYTAASGLYSHAEGFYTTASGNQSHAEGSNTTASGNRSHAEGDGNTASGNYSHAEGNYTTAQSQSQHVFGEYNVLDTAGSATTRGTYVEIVGNGTSSKRSNARTLDWSGNETLAGKLTVGSAPTNDMDVATKKYVDDNSPIKGTLNIALYETMNEVITDRYLLSDPNYPPVIATEIPEDGFYYIQFYVVMGGGDIIRYDQPNTPNKIVYLRNGSNSTATIADTFYSQFVSEVIGGIEGSTLITLTVQSSQVHWTATQLNADTKVATSTRNGLMSSTQYSRVAQLTDTYINNLIDAKIDAAIAGGY